MAEAESAAPEAVQTELPAAPDRRIVPMRPGKPGPARRPRVDRREGLTRLAIALVVVFAAGAFTLIKSQVATAETEPAKPRFIQLDSQRDKG